MDNQNIPTTFKYILNSKEREFSVIAREKPEENNKPYRIITKLTDGTNPEVSYIFHSPDNTIERVQLVGEIKE